MLTSLSIFLPAYNEADNLPDLLKQIHAFASKSLKKYEVIIIDDGSTDNTQKIASNLVNRYPNTRIFTHQRNLGYGAAIKNGLVESKYPWVFFMDSDGQFDIKELKDFLEFDKFDLVVGYRIKRDDPPRRIFASKVYGQIVKFLFGFKVKDIDCAFKLMNRQKVLDLNLYSDSFFISTELLVKSSRQNLKVKEIGVHHYKRAKGASTVTTKRVLDSLLELAKLFLNLHNHRR